MTDPECLFTKRTLADFLNMSERWVTGMTNRIPHYRIGREYRFRKCEVLEWMERYREIGTTVDLNAIGEAAKARMKFAVRRKEA